MTTIQIQISHNLAPVDADQVSSIAAWVLKRQGIKRLVSDPGVVGALLAQARKQGIVVNFYMRDERLNKVSLDLAAVRRVLGGGKAVAEPVRPGD